MLKKFFPNQRDPVQTARTRLIMQTSLGIALVIFAMLAYWIILGILESITTVYAGIAVILVLAGVAALARSGRVRSGAWILVIFLMCLVLAPAGRYGIESMSSAGYLLPVVLAAMLLGFWSGMGVATLGVIAIWMIGFAAANGALQTEIPYQESALSFTAPLLTLLYLLFAALVGSWSDHITRLTHI